jgi:hypothetical protein
MAAKVSFDPVTKIITVTEPPDIEGFVDLDVKIDLYSDGKEDWKNDANLNKYRFFMRAVGGDALPGSKQLGSTFFLRYGWKIRPYEASHTLRISGNLYAEDGSTPILPTLGTYTVLVVSSVSSLVDSTSQQTPQDIAGAVWDEALFGHTADGSAGKTVTKIDKTVAPLPGLL